MGAYQDVLKSLLHQCCRAMAHIHSLHIVHRDLRLDNFLVAGQTTHPVTHAVTSLHVVLNDFGLAYIIPDGVSSTTADMPHGPSAWMAPEVASSDAEAVVVSKAADVYMFGCLAFEMLSGGRRPWFWIGGVGVEDKFTLEQRRETANLNLFKEAQDMGKLSREAVGLLAPRTLELLTACVEVDPAKRPKAVDLRDHFELLCVEL